MKLRLAALLLVAGVASLCSCSEKSTPEDATGPSDQALLKAGWQDAGVSSDRSTIIDTAKLVYGPNWSKGRLAATYILDSLVIPNTSIGSSWPDMHFIFMNQYCNIKPRNDASPLMEAVPIEIRQKNEMIWLKVSFENDLMTFYECSLVFLGESGPAGFSGTVFTWFSDDDSEVMYTNPPIFWSGITKHPIATLSPRPFYKAR